MKRYKSNWDLKNQARVSLSGNWSETILFTFVYGLFSIAHIFATTLLLYWGGDMTLTLQNMMQLNMPASGYLWSTVVTFFFSILLGFLSVGENLVYLNIACGASFSIKDLFHACKENPGKYLVLAFIQTGLQYFFAIPGYICNYISLVNPADQWMILAYISQLAGQLISYPLILSISQSYRLLLDYPSLSVWDCLRHSNRLMKGHKVRLLWLSITFLPMEIACAFSCGIGYLWVLPYMNMTYAHFYLDLVENAEDASSDEFDGYPG